MSDEVNAIEENREEQQVQEAVPTSSQVSAGAQLVALREARGWTIEQVASQLNLATRQIQALELDNYAALPGMVIVRGFIRSYAKLLRTDPAPILAAIANENVGPEVVLQDRGSLSTAFSEGKVPSAKSNSSSVKVLLVVVAVVVIAAVGVMAQRMGWLSKKADHETAVKTQEMAVPEHVTAMQSEVSAPAQTPAEETTPQTPATESMQQPQAAAEEKPHAPVAAAVATSADNSAPVPVDSKNAMVFQVKEDTWVEIRRADDSILVSRLFKAGTTEAFEIAGPASMVVGNAAGVSVTLRGKPLDLTGNSSNVARLNVK